METALIVFLFFAVTGACMACYEWGRNDEITKSIKHARSLGYLMKSKSSTIEIAAKTIQMQQAIIENLKQQLQEQSFITIHSN